MLTMQSEDPDKHPSRLAWTMMEPYHTVIYFAPEARAAYSEAGLKGYWMGYFASRAAAMGPVPASVVTATFYNFHPNMVARAIPDAWRFSTPEKILSARQHAADVILRRLLGDNIIASAELAEAAELAKIAAGACSVAGRPLFAGHASLPWPEQSHLALWHATTLLREFRGDGHIAALLAENVDGCEAHLTMVGKGTLTREAIQPNRGWSDEDWRAAQERLIQRGWLDQTGTLTTEGQNRRRHIEQVTDELALPPWQALGENKFERLLSLMKKFSIQILEQGGVPMPNPVGVPDPRNLA
ncbi:SCO6745 family protein [Dictyobacter formicarum]